ncbi:MAG: ABC transporter substrate-binding protein [Promethearchaeota archaeon]
MTEELKISSKTIFVVIFVLLLAISSVIILSITLLSHIPIPYIYPPFDNYLIIGYSDNPDTIDPVDTWDKPSQNVEQQVIEGLVKYNLSSYPNYQIVGVLATDWHWHGTEFKKISFALRQDVLFHDNTTFDADDIIWNFDRLTWFCNYTGTLPDNATSWLAFPSSLYWFSDGVTPIIADYYKNNQYNVTFELSRPFAPFLELLTYVAGYIISPESTPRWTYIDLTTGDLVGTGPFQFIGFMYDVEVRFERFNDYWGDLPWAELLVFDINEDDTTRNMDMLALRIDYLQAALPENLDTFNESAQHTVYRFGEGLCYFFLTFHCGSAGYPGLNVTWRKALQYAINYTYIIDEIYAGAVVRGPPVVPRLMPGHNSSVQIIDTNITKARQLIMSMFPVETAGFDPNYPGNTESNWTTLSPLKEVAIHRHYGSTTNMLINQNINETFTLIGVDAYEPIILPPMPGQDPIVYPWDIQYIGWCADYLDAFNMLDPLFNNASCSNFACVNDSYLQSLFDQALQELDPTARQQIYRHIQSYLFEVNTPMHEWKYPHAPLFTVPYFIVHGSHLQGVSYNPLQILDCWNWYI